MRHPVSVIAAEHADEQECADCGSRSVTSDGICGSCGMEQRPEPPHDSISADPSTGTATAPFTGPTSRSSSVRRPPVVARMGELDDPASLIVPDLALPESKRFCRNPLCHHAVGRSRDGRPGRVEGYCQECRWPFSFRPPLEAGMLVEGRYAVLGAIGRGGLGWVYLARDRRLHHHVVLKGLNEPELSDSAELTGSELEALLDTDQHPNIVTVYNKVTHDYRPPGPDEKTVPVDYIVMELVRGRTLRQLLRARLEAGNGHLPPDQVCEFLAKALDGLGHLHALGLAYNDFSDDNVMWAADERIRIIDLGGVSEIGSTQTPQHKRGYADPDDRPPSVQSDLFTVGRTALRLTVDAPEFRHAEHGIPDPAGVELFRRHESFHLLLCRSTHPDPARRFGSSEENADAYRAVAREIRSADHGPQPGRSRYFGGGRRTVGDDPDHFPGVGADRPRIALSLPELQVDVGDRHAGRLTALLNEEPGVVRDVLAATADPSPESRLLAVRSGLRMAVETPGPGAPALVDLRAELDDLAGSCPPHAWPASFAGRVAWVRGVVELAVGSLDVAHAAFRDALCVMPGEPAPKLGLAHCAELLAATDATRERERRYEALRYFAVVWGLDRSWVAAGFGVARCHAADGNPVEAEQALFNVPPTSRHAANSALCALAVAGPQHDLPPEPLRRFFARAERLAPGHRDPLEVDERRRELSTITVLNACLAWITAHRGVPDPRAPRTVLGYPMEPAGLHDGLERAYRNLAGLPGPAAVRNGYVDQANRVRGWSLW